MHALDESHILLFLLQVSLLLALARAGGLWLYRRGQPAITAEILVGILMGPTVFGRLAPAWHARLFPNDPTQQNMLDTVAWLGILFFLLQSGLETNLVAALRQKRDALAISLSDLLLPIGLMVGLAWLLPSTLHGPAQSRMLFSLLIATIMTISALPVTARVLQDLGIYRSDASLLTLCALTLNDLAGWVVFAVILGYATDAAMSLSRIPLLIGATILFTVFCLTAGRRFTDAAIRQLHRWHLPQPGASLTLICILGMLAGATTIAIGIHALFGFFMAGIMAGESEHLQENTREAFSQMVKAVLVPLFFVSIGLKIDFLSHFNLPLLLFMLLFGVAARFAAAWVGVGLTSHPRANRHLIAAAHTPGGEMQIVIGLLALEYGVIAPPVFVAIMGSAVISSITLGPWMRYALLRSRRAGPIALLEPRHVVGNLPPTSRDEVIRLLTERVAEGGLDAQSVAHAVTEREGLMTTALGDGVAIPHARLPGLAAPRLAFGRIRPPGIPWNAPDALPILLVFLLLTPDDDDQSQLIILRTIAKAMSHPTARAALLEASEADLHARLTELLQ